MLSVDEALDRCLSAARLRGPGARERVALSSACGRVLAETVISPINVPTRDYSAMDGYALRAVDAPESGSVLPVVGESRTGHESPPLQPGTCQRIFTGAHIPAGADCVVIQEDVERTGDQVLTKVVAEPGRNIRRAGEDLSVGQTVLEMGKCLSPFDVGLLCTVERTEVTVFRPPRVTVLCTGDELRPPGSTFFGGSLAESNSLALASLIQMSGGEAHRAPLVQDELQAMERAIDAACRESDLVLTVGGVSVGDHDLVAPVLERSGAEVLFHKVRIKPGKPALLARHGACLVLGLPGNPSSAQVVFTVLGLPLLRALAGRKEPQLPLRTATMGHAFHQKSGRRGYYRGALVGETVEILGNQASGASTSSAWANCFVIVDEATETLTPGQSVFVLSYAEL